MRHMIQKLLSLMLALVLTVGLAACSGEGGGGGASKASIAGDYELIGMKYVDEDEMIPDFESLALTGTLTLNEDGTGELTAFGYTNDVAYDTETKKITIGETERDFTFENNLIEFTTDDTFVYVFEKKENKE